MSKQIYDSSPPVRTSILLIFFPKTKNANFNLRLQSLFFFLFFSFKNKFPHSFQRVNFISTWHDNSWPKVDQKTTPSMNNVMTVAFTFLHPLSVGPSTMKYVPTTFGWTTPPTSSSNTILTAQKKSKLPSRDSGHPYPSMTWLTVLQQPHTWF